MKKNIAISMIVALAFLMVLGVACWWLINDRILLKNELAQTQEELISTQSQNDGLLAENEKLIHTSNLKSFENEKALANFLDTANTYVKYSDAYPSEAIVYLMKEARGQGYWMGLTAINRTDESVWEAMYREKIGQGADVFWNVTGVVVVGDKDIYIVDPKDKTGYYFVVTMTGDFAEYNKELDTMLRNDRIFVK
jgi:CHASE3 domain sensor protein